MKKTVFFWKKQLFLPKWPVFACFGAWPPGGGPSSTHSTEAGSAPQGVKMGGKRLFGLLCQNKAFSIHETFFFGIFWWL